MKRSYNNYIKAIDIIEPQDLLILCDCVFANLDTKNRLNIIEINIIGSLHKYAKFLKKQL